MNLQLPASSFCSGEMQDGPEVTQLHHRHGYCEPDRWGHKGHSTRVPFNRISPAQREGKQRWLKEERWNEALERFLTVVCASGRRIVHPGGTRVSGAATQEQKWKQSISTETTSCYAAGVKWEED